MKEMWIQFFSEIAILLEASFPKKCVKACFLIWNLKVNDLAPHDYSTLRWAGRNSNYFQFRKRFHWLKTFYWCVRLETLNQTNSKIVIWLRGSKLASGQKWNYYSELTLVFRQFVQFLTLIWCCSPEVVSALRKTGLGRGEGKTSIFSLYGYILHLTLAFQTCTWM